MLGSRSDPCGIREDAIQMSSAKPSGSKVFIVAAETPLSEPFELEVQVCPAKDIPLHIDASMPTHQHGMNYKPEVEKFGNGR